MNTDLVEVLGEAERCARETLDATVDHVSLLAVLSAHKNVIAGLEARCAAEVAKGGRWRGKGHRRAEEFVAEATGTSKSKAKKALETTRKLEDLPVVDQAVADGKLSPEQAEHVAKAASVAPSRQSELVEAAARETLVGLKKRCQKIVREHDPDPERTRARAHQNRSCSTGLNDDGSAYVHWYGTADVMADMKNHLDAESERLFHHNRTNGILDAHPARMADALTNLITGNPTPDPPTTTSGRDDEPHDANSDPVSDVAGDTNPATRTPPSTTTVGTVSAASPADGRSPAVTDPSTEAVARPRTSTGSTPTRRPQGVICRCGGRRPADLTVLVDLTALRRGSADPTETCEILGVGPVPVTVARDLLDDAFIRAVITNGTDIRTVTHFGRHCPEHLRTALVVRTRGTCEVPGCDREGRLEIDHNHTPYANGGPHSILNDALLCKPHHHQKTHDGYTLEGTPGQRIWRNPTGQILSQDPTPTSDLHTGTDTQPGLWDEQELPP